MNDLTHKTPKSKATAAEPNEASPTVSSSRRRLLKQASMAAPAMLTLGSGAAIAEDSCTRIHRLRDQRDAACKIVGENEDGSPKVADLPACNSLNAVASLGNSNICP